jgi:putative Holliday junction resolvase
MAFDVGGKRTGIALSDETHQFAFPHTVVRAAELHGYVRKFVQEQSVCAFVVGIPSDLLNRPTDGTEVARNFAGFLRKNFKDIPVYEEDERFTTKMALQTYHARGTSGKKLKNKELLDDTSAAIILQGFLMSKKYDTK